MKYIYPLLLLLLLPLTNVPQVKAQAECDPTVLVEVMNEDLATFGTRATDAPEFDFEELSILYFDLVELRHRYEDIALCDELVPLNNLMLQIIAEMGDLTVIHMAWMNNPDSSIDYALVLDREILSRNAATYQLFLAEAARMVNVEQAAATAAESAPAPSTGATFNTSGDVALNQWYDYRDGRFRVVGVIDPYVSQNWAQPRAGNRVIAMQLEIECETPAEGECTANSMFISDISLSNGRELSRGETISLVGDSSVPRFYAPQRGGPGETLIGWVYLEIPEGMGYTKMTVFDWTTLSSVGFSLQ